jgi:hypothetical protein
VVRQILKIRTSHEEVRSNHAKKKGKEASHLARFNVQLALNSFSEI